MGKTDYVLFIVKCNGIDCPIRKKCFRYLSKKTDKQMYFKENYYKNNNCYKFIDFNEFDKKYIDFDLTRE